MYSAQRLHFFVALKEFAVYLIYKIPKGGINMKLGKKLPMFFALVLAGSLLAACGKGNGGNGGGGQGGGGEGGGGGEPVKPEPVARTVTGITSLIGASPEKRTEILGALEKYAVDNMITGMPLFENGGYVMYNPRVVKGTENYITGYGFGIAREGYLTEDLTNPEVLKPSYYNTWDTTNPGKINALDDQGSQVADLYDYIAAGYFGTKMNAAKNGYDWYGVLSTKDRPYIVKDGVASFPDDPEATSDTWRVYVRTGASGGAMYRTNSSLADRAAFDGQPVQLEDYVNAFKILLCGKFNYYRGSELATKASGYQAIKGAGLYFNYTKSTGLSDTAFEQVGVKSGHDDEGDYLQFTLGAPTNRFYAMYALASNLYAPINMDFFNLVTDNGANPKNYGGYNSTQTTTPVDNILSTSAFYLEDFEEQVINFKRNDDYFERKADSNVYRIPGYSIRIWPAGKEDTNYGFNQFLDGKIDGSGIPLDYVEEYRNDPRTTTTTGTSVFKLNVNSCTQEVWNQLFGDEGTVAQLGDNAYECKPWMSNQNFIKGLFFSIDRNEFAAKRGSIASTNYFSSNYMMDAEQGIAYNATQEHKDALVDFWGDTLATGGFSLALSQAAFDEAVEELIAGGKVKDGDELTIECWWQAISNIKNYGNDIATYAQNAFNNSVKAKAHNLTLTFDNKAVDVWSDCYSKHLQVGQFDLGFGSISGNALDPLNFMEVLKSDNSSGFTLNWGADTSKLDLEYEGELWSYNTLWAAVDHGVVTYKGQEVAPATLSNCSATYSAAEGLKVSYEFADGKEAMKALTDDEDAQIIGNLSEEDYSLTISSVFLSANTSYAGVDLDPDGFVLDTYFVDPETSAYIYYQEFDSEYDSYVTYYVDGTMAPALDESWSTCEVSDLTFKDPDTELEVTGGKFVVTTTGDVAKAIADTELIAITLGITQNIKGVESNLQVIVTVAVQMLDEA